MAFPRIFLQSNSTYLPLSNICSFALHRWLISFQAWQNLRIFWAGKELAPSSKLSSPTAQQNFGPMLFCRSYINGTRKLSVVIICCALDRPNIDRHHTDSAKQEISRSTREWRKDFDCASFTRLVTAAFSATLRFDYSLYGIIQSVAHSLSSRICKNALNNWPCNGAGLTSFLLVKLPCVWSTTLWVE